MKRLQNEWKRQKYEYEQQILALQRELSQPSQITLGNQMVNMQSVPTMNHAPHTSFSRQAGSRYNQSSGNGTQQRSINQTNQRNELMNHVEASNPFSPLTSLGCFLDSKMTASFNTTKFTPMHSVPQGYTTDSQYTGQQMGYNGMDTCYPNSDC